MTEAEEKERLDKLNHPKSFFEAINNFNQEYSNYLKAQENLRKAKERSEEHTSELQSLA